MKKLQFLVLLLFVTAFQFYTNNSFAQQQDTTAQKPTQYRRGIELQEGYQSYEEKYFGKNLEEEKRRLFPLQSTGIWTELNPKVPRVDYFGFHFVNPDTGWAVGDLGAIIKTTNGGDDWTISETNTTTLLLKVHSFNGQIVIVTGYDGIILRSSDSGETFTQITSGTSNDLWGVQMVNDTLGWVCGLNQTLLKTTDAGLTWQPVSAGLSQHYWSLDFLNEQYGMIACGNGVVLKTINGGNSWAQIQAGDTRSLYTIDIIDSLHIAAAGERELQIQYEGGKNVYSSNAGATWIQNPDIPTYTDANWIEFVDTDTGYAITVSHGIYKTTNRGQNWFSVGGGGEWQLDLTEDGTGYSGGDGLNIYKRTNGIENWSRIFLNDNFSDVFFVNEQKGFIISWSGLSTPSGLYKTTNGGINWEKVPGAPDGPELLFLDSLTGFIGSNLIYKTTDGGESWYTPNGGSGGAGKIFFINDTIGWAIRSNVIYKTLDRGENWFTQFSATTGNFTSIYFVDSLYGWVSGGHPYKTYDGGQTWIEQTNSNIWNSDDVYFPSLDAGWIGKYSSIFNSLFKTTDGGLNWIGIPEVIGARKFYFFPDPVHWLTLGFSRYYITNDYGTNWLEFTEDVPAGLVSFSAPTNHLGFAVGSGGVILRYDDTTYVPVELLTFEAKVETNKIILKWVTASELNNYGFEIHRSFDNYNWKKIGFVNGKGTTSEITYYSYNDPIINRAMFYYRLKQINYDGSFIYSKVISVLVEDLPLWFNLSQNFPNPFNNSTIITYQIPTDEFVSLKLYDVLGNEVKTMVEENKKAGYYTINFLADELSSGIYFYQLKSNEYINSKKMILLK